MVRKYWKEENGVHTLYYIPFYDEIKLAEIELDGDECDDNSDKGEMFYKVLSYYDGENRKDLPRLNYVLSNSLDDVKDYVEESIIRIFEDISEYYEYLLKVVSGESDIYGKS